MAAAERSLVRAFGARGASGRVPAATGYAVAAILYCVLLGKIGLDFSVPPIFRLTALIVSASVRRALVAAELR